MSDLVEFVSREPCPACGSRDNLARYSDGHGYCFGCSHYDPGADGVPQTTRRRAINSDLLEGGPQALVKRRLDVKTCDKFGYWVGVDRAGNNVQIANYREAGQIVAQKVRDADKNFTVLGDAKKMGLFGQHLWRDGGKRVVVTEGEIDAMSVAQAFGLSWPVVSVPNGAQGAEKAIRQNLEWLETYGQVVLMFDQDAPGQAAAEACASLFSPGKCAIAYLPLKDASEMLQANRIKELCGAVYEARTYRPDGIVNGSDTWDAMLRRADMGTPYPPFLDGLNRMILGQHPGTLVTWTSGTGMGKSSVVAEIAYDLAIKQGKTVGYVALEESNGRTAQRFVGLHLQKPIHLPGVEVPPADLRTAFDATLGTGRVWFYDHFGSLGEDSLMSKLRFLIKGCQCDVLVVDHLSIIISGAEDSDERRLIDRTMTNLRSLVEETGCLMHLVSHLKRTEGRSAEEGARVSLSHLRGSHSIAQLSDVVIGLERDQQDEDHPDIATVRVLKDRLTGNTGVAGRLTYNKDTGRMLSVDGTFGGDVSNEF